MNENIVYFGIGFVTPIIGIYFFYVWLKYSLKKEFVELNKGKLK